jgi:heme-degrading monooxygenase HmoA
MICEITYLPIREGKMADFRKAWAGAERILARQPGYLSHEAGVQLETPGTVVLLIRWSSLEAHTSVFAQSADFPLFLGHFSDLLDGPATVVHMQSFAI